MPPQSGQEVNHRKFYYAFGVTTTIKGNELLAECPFCKKENHFYINQKTGQFECKSCGEAGNNWSFLQKLHAMLLEQPQSYGWLVGNRFLKTETFEHCQLVESPTGDWLIPVKNQKDSIVNLYRAYTETKEGKEKLTVISSPAPCTQHLYRAETVKPHHKKIYVCEGHWDTMALIEIMAHLHPYMIEDCPAVKAKGIPNFDGLIFQENAIVGVPGATTFKDGWLPIFKGKEVVLIFDNDKPGRLGCDRLVSMIQESSYPPASLSKIIWKDDDVKDIRDLLAVKNLSYLKAYQEIQERVTPITLGKKKTVSVESDTTLVEEECHSFTQLLEKITYDPVTKTGLHITPDIKYTFASMLAVVLSTPIKGGQLGLRVIGPASSAKSTLAEILSQNDEEWTFPRDTFTGIISGNLKGANMMAARMNGKCLIIKEADTILQMPNLAQIESELRSGLGDGVIRSEWRNSAHAIEIHSLFTCIMCGTSRVRDIDDARLGSRFMDIVIHQAGTDTTPILESSFDTSFTNISKQLAGTAEEYDDTSRKSITMRAAPFVNGFLRYKSELIQSNVEIAPFTEAQKKRAKALAKLLAYARAKVDRDRQKQLKRRGEIEVPARINELLMRFFMILPIVLYDTKKFRITNEVFDHIVKLVRDSSAGWQFDIMEILYRGKNQPITTERLAQRLRLSKTHIENVTKDMKELGIIESSGVKAIAGKGRMAHHHTLTAELFELCKEGLR